MAKSLGFRPVEAAPAPPVLQQQPPHPPSAKAPNPVQPNLRHQTLHPLQNPNLSLQLPVHPSLNLSLPQHPLKTPPRTPQLRLELQPPHQHLFLTGIRQLPRNQPGPQGVRMLGLRPQSGQRA